MVRMGARAGGLALNLAVGPSCFVRCRGCYNHFAGTGVGGSTVTASELLDFVDDALSLGLEQVTLSGGDPLSHPEIIDLLRELARRPLTLKMDTVGTAILSDTETTFFGRKAVKQVSAEVIASLVQEIGIPMDGFTAGVQNLFRTGRPSLNEESYLVIRQLLSFGARLCINTVVHRANQREIPQLARMIADLRPASWQLFQFQPAGPMGSRNRSSFMISDEAFADVVRIAQDIAGPVVATTGKSISDRSGIYLLVDDAGVAYIPSPNSSARTVVGHISQDRTTVLGAIRSHFAERDIAI